MLTYVMSREASLELDGVTKGFQILEALPLLPHNAVACCDDAAGVLDTEACSDGHASAHQSAGALEGITA